MNSTQSKLGRLSLAMITVAAIVSLRNLPLSAEFGFSSVFYFALAIIIFFIPTAMVTAELGSTWPKAGGSYAWVKEAFGSDWGLFTLWVAWMESISWFPAILAFTAAMLGYLIKIALPGFELNSTFMFIAILAIFWGATFLNFAGIGISSAFSSLGVMVGTIIPAILIIGLGGYWYFSGQPLQIEVSAAALIPDFQLDSMVIFSGILLSLAGVELAAFHVAESKNPQKDYPAALAIAAFVILFVYVLGTLAIAFVVPKNEINLASGLLQAFDAFFAAFSIKNFSIIMASCLLLGSLAGINTWTVGPAKGMLVVAEDGYLPTAMTRTNKHNVPIILLIVQAIIGSLLTFVFLLYEDSTAIWIMIALSSQFTMLQYLMLIFAVIKLRKSQPGVIRGYKVPFLGLMASIGAIGCIFSFLIVYVPPVHFDIGDPVIYQSILVGSMVVLLLPLLWFRAFRSRNSSR